jgi:hypothetical protein
MEIRESLGVCERKQKRPEVEPIDKEKDQEKGGAENESRKPITQAVAHPAVGLVNNRQSDGLGSRSHGVSSA